MFFLETHSPLAAAPPGFPRREGAAYLPGRALREALLTAALAYAIQRDEAFAAEMRRLAQHAFKGSAEGLAAAMEAALLERQPELAALAPADLQVPEPATHRVQLLDTRTGEVEGELELELVEGRMRLEVAVPRELETWLAGATRSYAEALAGAEEKALLPALPEAGPCYQELKARTLKSEAWPLRIGYWTPDPEGGRFLAFERLSVAAQALERRFGSRPLPGRLFYDPKEHRTLGWALLGQED